MKRVFVGIAVAAIACGGRGGGSSTVGNRASTPSAPAAADASAGELPADAQALIDRWESCQHWAGEEPYDAERRREIEDGIARSCPGNEETRAELERRYADRPDVLARLAALDP